MNLPRISIIIPVLNQERYISQAIESVLGQDYSETELIIIDGGSHDGTVRIIKRYEKYIGWWVSEKDIGQSDAINKGLKVATGDIVNWLNADDYYTSSALSAVGNAFIMSDALCVCGVTRVFGTGKVRYKKSYINRDDLEDTLSNILIEQPSTFFKKRVFEELGGLSTCLHYVMDRYLWIRFLDHYGLNNIAIIEDQLCNFRHHEKSKTVCQKNLFIKEYAALLNCLCADPALRRFLEEVAGETGSQISICNFKTAKLPAAYVDHMAVNFLLKYSRDLARQGVPAFSKRLVDAVNMPAYGMGRKEWKWYRQVSCSLEGKFSGFIKYIRARYHV